MPPKQRQIQMQQQGGLAAMQQLETRSDEELEREQKFKRSRTGDPGRQGRRAL